MGEWFLKIRPGFLFASVSRGVLKSQVGVTDSQAEDLSLRRSLDLCGLSGETSLRQSSSCLL